MFQIGIIRVIRWECLSIKEGGRERNQRIDAIEHDKRVLATGTKTVSSATLPDDARRSFSFKFRKMRHEICLAISQL